MPLRMDWSRTPRYQRLSEDERKAQRADFESVGWAMFGADIGPTLNSDNVYELWARCQVMSGISRIPQARESFAAVRLADLKDLIGFTINSGTVPRAKWAKLQMDSLIQSAKYDEREDARKAREMADG